MQRRPPRDQGTSAGGTPFAEAGVNRPVLPRWITVLAVIALAFLGVPVGALVLQVPWDRLGAILSSQGVIDTIRVSIVCSLLATAFASAVGIPLATWLARSTFRGRSFVRGIVILPVILPPVFAGVALLSAFGRSGLVGGWLYETFNLSLARSTAGAALAEAFVAMPFLVLAVEGALRSTDPALEQAASTLGAGPWTVFRRITFPSVAPAIGAGAMLAWARALGEFGATITFAKDVPGVTRTLPLAAYAALDADRDAAIVLGALLVVVSLAVIVALRDRWLMRT